MSLRLSKLRIALMAIGVITAICATMAGFFLPFTFDDYLGAATAAEASHYQNYLIGEIATTVAGWVISLWAWWPYLRDARSRYLINNPTPLP